MHSFPVLVRHKPGPKSWQPKPGANGPQKVGNMEFLRVDCKCGWRYQSPDPESKTYLEALADSHEAQNLRQSRKHETTEVYSFQS